METVDSELKARRVLGEEQFILFKQVQEKKNPSWIEARNKLVEMNKGLVGFTIERFFLSVFEDPQVEYDDVFQEGIVGLSEAIKKFKLSFGKPFSTYAVWWIRHVIRRYLINQISFIRVPANVHLAINKANKKIELLQQELGRTPITEEIAEKMETESNYIEGLLAYSQRKKLHTSLDKPIGDDEDGSLCEFITYPDQQNPLEIVMARHDSRALREKIKSLVETGPFKEKTKKVFCLRFGLKDGEFHVLREIGEMMGGVSRESIRQRVKRVLNYLRQPEILKQIKEYAPRGVLGSLTPDTFFTEYKTISLREKTKLYSKAIELVALLYGLEKAALFPRYSKRGKINQARAMVAYVCKELGLSFSDVGKKMGLKLHTLHSRRYSFLKRMRKNFTLKREIFLIEKALSQKDSQAFPCNRCQKPFPLEEMRSIHQRKYCTGSLTG